MKWLLSYLNGSSRLGLVYGKAENDQVKIKGFCDADLDKRRSLTGYVSTLGGNVVSWKSTLQHIVALSTIVAEYVTLTKAIKEAIRLKGITNELDINSNLVKLFLTLKVLYICQNILYFMKE